MSNKTIDEILHTDNILAGTEAKLTEIGYERLGENIQEATQAIERLVLQERIKTLNELRGLTTEIDVSDIERFEYQHDGLPMQVIKPEIIGNRIAELKAQLKQREG